MARSTVDIDELLAAMSLEEKIGQLTMLSADMAISGPGLDAGWLAAVRAGRVGSLLNVWGAARVREAQRLAVEETRLGIPLLCCLDVIHGHRTIFPIPLGEAAAFDPELWERTARAAAAEAAADGLALTFAPMLDVCRDPRWGRIAEGPGEDPFLAQAFAVAKVRGFQGGDPAAPDRLAACAKHLGAYGAVAGGRDYAPVDISERQLHEVYLPPFAAAVATDVAAIMPAFNDLAGIPISAHRGLLRGIVRGRWGFEGVMISDYSAIAELIAHGVAGDAAEAAALALEAGVDIDMMGFAYERGLPEALARGKVSIDLVDAAVRRVLTLKQRLGLFADPFARCGGGGAAPAPVDRDLAREAARRSIVLLTNHDDLLPLEAAPRRLALIGPLADAPAAMLGTWPGAGDSAAVITYLAGLRALWPSSRIEHAQGVDVEGPDADGIAAAVATARAADIVVLCLGEHGALSGEAASRGRVDLPGRQAELADAVLDTGVPVVLVLTAGRPLVVPAVLERARATLMAWGPGTEAGNALADILSGAPGPTGRLPVSWPEHVGQIPVFFGQRPTGRPPRAEERFSAKYLDLPVAPRFAFGHGLAYTRFAYRGLRTDRAVLREGEPVTVEVEIVNEGPRAGEETVLLFSRDVLASVARPLLELKGFAKLALEPGEAGTARFVIQAEDLVFLGADLEPTLEDGWIELCVGPSADPARLLRTRIELTSARSA